MSVIPSINNIASIKIKDPSSTLDVEDKLLKNLIHLASKAINNFSMIENGDLIMVCLSGGKDSYTLLDILIGLKLRFTKVNFDIIAVNLDQKQPGFPHEVLPNYLTKMGIPFHIETRNTYEIVKKIIPEGKKTCSLCSRLRRGILYRVANELGATKIALGHHRDDVLETFLLNIFFSGRLKTMPPILRSDDGLHTIIRPLTYITENQIIRYAEKRQFPIIPCNLCGAQSNLKRMEMKALLQEWQSKYPDRVKSLFTSLFNVTPSHLLDKKFFSLTSSEFVKSNNSPFC